MPNMPNLIMQDQFGKNHKPSDSKSCAPPRRQFVHKPTTAGVNEPLATEHRLLRHLAPVNASLWRHVHVSIIPVTSGQTVEQGAEEERHPVALYILLISIYIGKSR